LWAAVQSNGGVIVLDPDIVARAQFNAENMIIKSKEDGSIEVTAVEHMGSIQ
jgi:hypothetical protein